MELDLLGNLERTHSCGELRLADEGKSVVVMGWVNRRRDHGDLIFLDLRDRAGMVQIVLDKELCPEAHARAESVRPEFVIAVEGRVRGRGVGVVNPNMPTGEIEIQADTLRILNDAKTPPFSPAEDAIANEELRLKYRYIDLRRPEMQRNVMLRHAITLAIRENLAGQGFLEIETPYMTRSTPEGARDYLVPSRVRPGEFYALPQSPQIFKQILMISGLERYFQIARCFRDEDLRADRQPEFTQVDLEMTFPQQETVFRVVESFLAAAFAAAGIVLPTPFPQITYDESVRRFGSDKPDMRLPELVGVEDVFAAAELESLGIEAALPVVAVRVAKAGELSRKEREENRPLFDTSKGAKLIDDLKRLEKSFPAAVATIRERTQAAPEDLVVIVAGDAGARIEASDTKIAGRLSEREIAVYSAAGILRTELSRKYAARHGAFAVTERVVETAGPSATTLRSARDDSSSYQLKHSRSEENAEVLRSAQDDELFSVGKLSPESELLSGAEAFFPIWVTDFPMFEFDPELKQWMPAHHPFTSPHEEDMERLLSDPASVRARYYDLAMNGLELGSGSIRIYRKDVQAKIFASLGMSDAEAKERFGFFLEALEYGTPPHGGIALGLDRIVMILAGAQSLREVIAFPKTAKAVDLMVEAPSPVSDLQLRELQIQRRRS